MRKHISFLTIALLFFSTSANASLIFPFVRDNVWEICQGYNTPNISHKNTLIYSLDFAYGTGNLGSTGCWYKPTVSENKAVLAPASGTIAWNGSTAPDITCLKLDTSISNGYGANINSIKLGHLKSNSQRLGAGAYVNQGDTIGLTCGSSGCATVGGYAHIHMGGYQSSNCSGTTTPLGTAFGQGFNFSNNGSAYQWHGTQIPKSTSTSSSNSDQTVKGVFDGAGSLVNPSQDCFGCNKDYAVMQPHQYTNSTVAFQWLYSSSSCAYIDITATKNITAVIRSKAWSEHLTQKAIKVSLSSSPITLSRPSSNVWTTLAITSTAPVSSPVYIKATCLASNGQFKTGNRSNVTTDLVDVTYDYYWTGTGSLITNANRTDFGVTKDWAATFHTKNSLTSFQWLALERENCTTVQVADSSGKNIGTSILNGVHIKPWNSATWSNNLCSSLPCNITAPDQDYYIIKVKSAPDAFSGSLQTRCVK